MRPGRPGHSRRGTFSTPERVRGLSLTAASIRANVAGPTRRGTSSTPEGVRRGWSLSAAAMRASRPGPIRRGIISTPEGVRRGWSLSAAAMRASRPGDRRHGIISTPEGVRRGWFLSAAATRAFRPGPVRRGIISTSSSSRTVATLAHAGSCSSISELWRPLVTLRQRWGPCHGAEMRHVRVAIFMRAAQELNVGDGRRGEPGWFARVCCQAWERVGTQRISCLPATASELVA